VSFYKSSWSAIVITLLSALGDVLIASPLALNKSVAIFFFRTANGNSVLAFIEMFFPALTFILLSFFPVSIIPSFGERKIKKLDLVRVVAFGFSFYWVYRSLMKLLISLLENPQHILSDLVSDWLAATSSIILYFYIYYQTNKEHEEERLRLRKLEEQNHKLTELTQQLQAMKLTPREVAETINSAITRLQKFQEANLAILSQIQPLELPGDAPKPDQIYLSPREISVLKLVGQGKNNREIAETLKLKESYIKGTVSRLYDKLQANDRGGLVLYAIKAGIVNIQGQIRK
jgi:DNA-binding CsgD family transcriptional regulator